ncbi:MAG: argininosuccinate synthase [Candidatus Bipolaricaulota bacterium]
MLLMYSGGLDTSVILKWIQENYDSEVSTLTVDLGQQEAHLDQVREKALSLGAQNAFVDDLKEEFAGEFISRAIKANALYQGQYPLSTAIGRPLMSQAAVNYAQNRGFDAIAHGSTGKGNDQVRFEASINALAPEIEVLAPVRTMQMNRDEEIAYAEENEIQIPVDINSPYSIDENLWGRSIECGVLEDPSSEPPEEVYQLTEPISQTPDEPSYVELVFEDGLPVKMNGKSQDLVDLILSLNQLAGSHGVGQIDMVEDRVVGLKSREVYECPAAVAIITAHKDLEKYCSTIHENGFKPLVDQRWSEMAYKGLMFDPLVDELDAYLDAVNRKVEGTVRLKFFKGQAKVVGRESKNAIYSKSLATYDQGSTFDQTSSEGFIDIWGLPTRVANSIHTNSEPGEI